jgi:hypothetical protein
MPQQARANVLDSLLTRHPREIGESYAEHAGHAIYIGTRMIAAGLACLVHAMLPGLFVRTATRSVADIQDLMAFRSGRSSGASGGLEATAPKSRPR